MEIKFDFKWQIEDNSPHWYQVESSPAILTEESVGFNPNDSLSGKPQKYIQQIMALSVEDVCKQLAHLYDPESDRSALEVPFSRWPVSEIKQFSNTAYMDKGKFDPPPSVTMTPIDWTQVPECLEMTVIARPKVDILFDSQLSCIGIEELGINCQVGDEDDEHIVPLSFSNTTYISRTDLTPPSFTLGIEASIGGSSFKDVVLKFTNFNNNLMQILVTAGSLSAYRNDLIILSTGKILIKDINNSIGKHIDLINFNCTMVQYTGGEVASIEEAIGGTEEGTGNSTGALILSGEITDPIVHYIYYPAPILNLSNTDVSTNWCIASGGLIFGSESVRISDQWTHTSAGGLSLSGDYRILWNYETDGSSIALGDSATVTFNTELIYVGTGGVILAKGIGGGFSLAVGLYRPDLTEAELAALTEEQLAELWDEPYSETDLGEFGVEIVATTSIPYFKTDYPVTVVAGKEPVLPISPAIINSLCGCEIVPQIVKMRHNIVVGNSLKDFMTRNLQVFPEEILLKYSALSNSWSSQQHFVGTGNNDTDEKWDMVFELRCMSEGAIFWQFSVNIKKNTNVGVFDTHLLYNLEKNPACYDKIFNVVMTIATQAGGDIMVDPEMQYATKEVYLDRIGLFKSSYWAKNPSLVISLDTGSTPLKETGYDVSSIFPEPYLV